MSDDDESIGSAGTIPVEPDNPLYDAVKSGGGFVEDEDGNVSGGPDGDGTARTEEERTSNSDSGEDDSDGSSSGGETNAQKRNRLIRQSGSSGGGGSSGRSSSGGGSSGGGGSGGSSSGVRERAANIKDRAFEQVQQKTDAVLDRDDVTISRDGDSLSAKFTDSGRRKEAVADRKKELASDVPGATADDVVIEPSTQQIVADSGQSVSFDDLPVGTDTAETPTQSTQMDTAGQSLVEQGRSQRDPETGEAIEGRGAAERKARDLASRFREGISGPVGDVTGDVADVVQSGASVSAASNPALLLSGASDPGNVQGEIEEGPERVRDIGRAPENEQSSQRGAESFGEGVGQGAAELLNLPAFAVTAIEAGEVARAGGEAAVDGQLGEFANTVSAAGAAAAADTADAATDNPAQFGGQLVGGAAAGLVGGAAASSAARRAVQRGTRSGRRAGIAPEQPGTGGVDSLFDQRQSASRSPSSRGSQAGSGDSVPFGDRFIDDTGRSGSGGLFDSDTVRRFIDDEDAQLGRGRQRPSQSTPDRVDDRFRGFDSEIRRAALEQREFGDFRDLDRGGINDVETRSRDGGTRPRSERTTRGGQSRRRRSERSEVRQTDEVTGDGSLLNFEAGGTGTGALVGAGLQEQAQQAEVTTPNVDVGPSNDVGIGPDVGVGPGIGVDTTPGQPQDSGPQQGQPTDTDIGAGFDFDFGQPPRTGTPEQTGTPTTPDTPVRPPNRPPDSPNQPPRRPRVDNDDENDESLFAGSGLFGSSSSEQSSGAGTGFIAETLTGFGEGGLNVEAASAAGSSQTGFLETQAQAEGSAGFEEASELFRFGGE